MKNNASHKIFICSGFSQLHSFEIRRLLFTMGKGEAAPILIYGREKYRNAKLISLRNGPWSVRRHI